MDRTKIPSAKELIRMRYEEDMTGPEIGEAIGVTRQWAVELVNQAIEKEPEFAEEEKRKYEERWQSTIRQIEKLVNQGETQEKIAEILNIDIGKIRRLIRNHNIKKQFLTRDFLAYAILVEGLTDEEIAEKCGRSPGTIKNRRLNYQLKREGCIRKKKKRRTVS